MWIQNVHHHLCLLPETLYLAIYLFDRFLSIKVVARAKVGLVAVTCILVAAKFEEIVVPSMETMLNFIPGVFTRSELLKAEVFLLKLLDHNLGYPNPLGFMRRINQADEWHTETRTVVKYIIEATLTNEQFLQWPGSCLAAAATYLAKELLAYESGVKPSWVSASSSS